MTLVGVFSLFMIIVMLALPGQIEKLTADIMKKSAGSDFIVKLLTDNLALGMEAMPLDNGASVDQTLEMLRIGAAESLIESIAIFDPGMKRIRGTENPDITNQHKDTDTTLIWDHKERLIIFSPLTHDNKKVGYMEILFTKAHVLSRTKKFLIIIYSAGTVVIIFGLLLAFFISKTIISVLQNVSGKMGESANHVSEVSGQVSSASRFMAGQAAEQTASINEISCSMNEMAIMIRQNAENANKADILTQEAGQVVHQANQAVEGLQKSIDETSKAADETVRIVKTIDDIAFQTNLLSLNAAVEAARAGEAGAGFSIVADEVRNLAAKSADAAKNTAEIIRKSAEQAKAGANTVKDAGQVFGKLFEIAKKVEDLVGEIASASTEQAQKTEHVNNSVSEIDRVTRTNASNAEQSSMISEKLNNEVEQMNHFLHELMSLVGNTPGIAQMAGKRYECNQNRTH